MGLVFLLLMAVVPLVVLLFINKWLANHWSWETLRYIFLTVRSRTSLPGRIAGSRNVGVLVLSIATRRTPDSFVLVNL